MKTHRPRFYLVTLALLAALLGSALGPLATPPAAAAPSVTITATPNPTLDGVVTIAWHSSYAGDDLYSGCSPCHEVIAYKDGAFWQAANDLCIPLRPCTAPYTAFGKGASGSRTITGLEAGAEYEFDLQIDANPKPVVYKVIVTRGKPRRTVIYVGGINSQGTACGDHKDSIDNEAPRWLTQYLTGASAAWVRDAVDLDPQPYYFSYSGVYCHASDGTRHFNGAAGDPPDYDRPATCGTIDNDPILGYGAAWRLEQLIKQVVAKDPATRVTIVAHSQGGFITSYLLGMLQTSTDRDDQGVREKVASVVTFDSFPMGLDPWQVDVFADLVSAGEINGASGCDFTAPTYDDWEDTSHNLVRNPVVNPVVEAAKRAALPPCDECYRVAYYTIAADRALSVATQAPGKNGIVGQVLPTPVVVPGDHGGVWVNPTQQAKELVGCALLRKADCSTLVTATSGAGTLAMSPNQVGPHTANTTVTLTATPAGTGTYFRGWTIDGAPHDGPNPYPLTMDQGHSVVAVFGAQPAPLPRLTAPVPPPEQGAVSVSRTGNQAVVSAAPAAGQLFLGWQVAGGSAAAASAAPQVDRWANPLILDLAADTTVTPVFAPRPAFGDVAADNPAADTITNLAARGVINGCDSSASPPLFCPDAPTLRHQMAALIVRAMPGWADEVGTPSFADNTEDTELMTRVATLQRHNVVRGYQDEVCQERGLAPPCYGPLDPVTHGQVLLFISRAMVAKGYWALQPDDRTIFPDQNGAEGADPDQDQQTLDHRMVVTYVHYVGNPPDVADAHANFLLTSGQGWGDAAPRAWFARAFWPALDSYFGH